MASEKLQIILELLASQYKREAREAAMATGQIGDAAAKTESAAGRMAGGIGKAASVIKVALAGAAVGAIVEVVGNLDQLGQKMEATERMADTVFGNMVADARAWADQNNEAFGIGEGALLGLLSKTQDLLVPMGFARDAAFDMSTEILNTANALSEWTGGTINAEDARLRIAKAILGEREGLIELGVKISEADVKTRLAEKGLDGLTGAALAQAKAQVTLELVMQRSTDALAAYEGRAGSAIAAQKELEATTADTAETWAEILRPAIDEGKDAMSDAAAIADFLSNKARDVTSSSEDAAEGGEGLIDVWRNATPVGAALLAILDLLAGATDETTKHTEKTTGVLGGVTDAYGTSSAAALIAVTATDKVAASQWGAEAATRAHQTALASLGDFLARQISPVLAAHGALTDLADAQTIADEAARDHGRNSEEFALAMIEVALKTAEAEAALGTFGANAPVSIDAVATALGISDEAAQLLLETLGLLDGMTVTTTIITDQINTTSETSGAFWAPPTPPDRGRTRGQISERAAGGSVSAGRPYLVGERGAEMMVPNQSGTILPNGWNRPNSTINVYSPTNNLAQDLQLATILATVNTMVEVQG